MQITKDTKLKDILKISTSCNMCGHCCSTGSGIVLKDEIKKISKHVNEKEDVFVKKYLKKTDIFNRELYKFRTSKAKSAKFGRCIFYDKVKGCKIHKVKPLHCRVGNCSDKGPKLSAWFTVNYLVDKHDPESIRQFNVYIKNGGMTLKNGQLKDLVKDKNKLRDILNYKILR